MNEALDISNSLSALNQFHFLRPLWLLAVIPAIALTAYFLQQKTSAVNWHSAINKQLLEHLLEASPNSTVRWPWILLLLTWLITAVAIAGPTWEKLPQPVHQKTDALVIILDLSLSMRAQDVKPSRLIRARHKTLDILSARDEGLTGLIAYSGDAHVVSPLTDDNATIANLLPALSPEMMPVNGSDPYAAVQLAKQLFNNAGHQKGRILLITDGITQNDLDDISDSINRSGSKLSILGVGTAQGAPIPMRNGFIRDDSGKIVVPKLPQDLLDNLARINGGRYADVSLNDKDIEFLLPTALPTLSEETTLSERDFDQWRDRGHWLVLVILPFALLAFRRGWLLLLPLFILLEPQQSIAFEWQDLWQRADQQAAKTLADGDAKSAAKQFKDKRWQGAAQYQANEFEAAAENFEQFDSADAHYNRGNALAKVGKLDDAIKAYDEALKRQPDMEDAAFNKALLEKLKQQQEQQQDSSDQNKNQDSNESQDSDQQGDQSQRSENSQQQEQENSDNKQSDQNTQQSSEQQQNNTDPSQDTKNDGADLPEEQAEKQKQQQAQQVGHDEQNDNTEQAKRPDQQQQPDEQEQGPKAQQQPPAQLSQAEQENKQKQQAMEQWLRQIPDEPSGLLRRKFDYEYRLRQRNQQQRKREQPKW